MKICYNSIADYTKERRQRINIAKYSICFNCFVFLLLTWQSIFWEMPGISWHFISKEKKRIKERNNEK
jgi:hypothetical protein